MFGTLLLMFQANEMTGPSPSCKAFLYTCLSAGGAAARPIFHRGLLLVAQLMVTALQGLMQYPELRPLVGGVTPVTLGDAEALRSNMGNKVTQHAFLHCIDRCTAM